MSGTIIDVTLTGTLIDELTGGGNTASGVYALFYDDANPNTASLQPLFVTTGATSSSEVTAVVTLPGGDITGGKLYILEQSRDNTSAILSLPGIVTQSSILTLDTASQTLPFATTYGVAIDSIELALTGTSTDAGNLTSVVEFGLPMGIGVTYGDDSSASVGYKISGGDIYNSLGSVGATVATFSSGPLQGKDQSALPPSTASDWDGYVAAVGAMAGSIDVSGFFNGARDASGTYHNAGYFAYTMSWESGANGGTFFLDPANGSQIQGTIEISATDLEDSIYQTNGTATIISDGTVFTTMNTGDNNQWGTVLRQFLVGFDAGYYGSTGKPVNDQLTATTSIDLNQSYNWDPTYAFGNDTTASPSTTYNSYAKVITDNSNSYGFGYSDAETAAYTAGGPLLSLYDPSTGTDVSQINLTVYGNGETPSGYMPPTIGNIVTVSNDTYAAVTGTSANNIVLDFSTGGPTNAGVVLDPAATIVLSLLTSDIGRHPNFTNVTLDGSGNGGLWQGWNLTETTTNGTISFAATPDGTILAPGELMIDDLPMSKEGGVSWYQVTEEDSAGGKTFNLYLTSDTVTSTLSSLSGSTLATAEASSGTFSFGTLNPGTLSFLDSLSASDISLFGLGTVSLHNGLVLEGTYAINAGTITAGAVNGAVTDTGSISNGSITGSITGYILDSLSVGATLTNGTLNDGSVSGVVTAGVINAGTIIAGLITGGTIVGGTLNNGTLENYSVVGATLVGYDVKDGSIENETISLTFGTVNGANISNATVSTVPVIENPNRAGQVTSAAVDGLGMVEGTGGTTPPQYDNSLTYNLAGADGGSSDPSLTVENTSTSVIDTLTTPSAPVAGTLGNGTFSALTGQDNLVSNTITSSAESLEFAWTGDNSSANTPSWISAYTNKVNGDDFVVITVSEGGSLVTEVTTTANVEGQWQTDTPISLDPGTYDITMRDYQAVIDTATGSISMGAALSPESGKLVLVENGTPCFCPGTRIRTETGEKNVEDLQIGDKLKVLSGACRPVKWIGRRSYLGAFAAANRNVWPIRIATGALGRNLPARDLHVSPEHAMYLDKHLVQAKHLVNGRNVTVTEGCERIDYFHIELDTHDVIFAEGAPTESFVDCGNRGMFHNADEFEALYPHDKPAQWQFCAAMLEGGRGLAAIQRRILARAAQLPASAVPCGEVQGFVDEAARDFVRGWAWFKGNDRDAVELEVMDNGVFIGTVFANQFRADLAEAGIGNGWHGFRLDFARPLDADQPHSISVRDNGCGAPLVGSPAMIEPATGINLAQVQNLRTQLGHAMKRADSAAEAQALLAMLAEEAERVKQHHASLLAKAGPVRKQRGTAAKLPARRCLVIDDAWPRPDRSAGAQAILSHIQAMQKLGWHVSFIAKTGAVPDEAAIASLEARNVTCLAAPAIVSVEEALSRQAGQFELIYLHRISVAAPYMTMIRHYQPRARIIYSVADLHHLRLARQGAVQGRPELSRAGQRVRQQELAMMSHADAVITHSFTEASMIAAAGIRAENLHVVPWAVRACPNAAVHAERQGLIFVGNFAHEPNLDGLDWLAGQILPLVRTRLPGMRVTVIGGGIPTDMARRISAQSVDLLGHVPDLAPLYAQARLAVAPLRFGAGIKGKILEAWAHGLPCVMTPIAAEGLPLSSCLTGAIAENARSFAEMLVALYEDAEQHRVHVSAGRAILRAEFSQISVIRAIARALQPASQAEAALPMRMRK